MLQQIWESIESQAVLGTERQPLRIPPATGQLGALLSQIDCTTPERALLQAVALITAYQRAASMPASHAPDTAAVAEPETQPYCSPQAMQHLMAMLHGSQRDVLEEWLQILAEQAQCVAPDCLPELLDAGRSDPQLRALIAQVVGNRGHWLAQHHTAWGYLMQQATAFPNDWETLKQQWEVGGYPDRLALLQQVRRSYPDPARALLELTWASEKADHRSAFLALFEQNLTLADELFLEAALDDRSKEVRTVAVELLARLPESRLVKRTLQRLEAYLQWEPAEPARLLGLQKGRPGMLRITLPETCDKAMARDGVNPKPVMQQQNMGERAQWLLQMLRLVAPTIWVQRFRTSPTELIAAASRNEWRTVVEAAWIFASQHHRDPAWAEAFVRSDPAVTSLLAHIPSERQELILLDMLAANHELLANHPALGLLQATSHTWSGELTHAVLVALQHYLSRRRNTNEYRIFSACDDFARHMHPQVALELCSGWPASATHDERWQGILERMLVKLHFRAEMRAALTQK
jgi:hypothetical protein